MKVKYTKNFLKYISLIRQNKVKFFVFDGLDGSGKGVLSKLLSQYLLNYYDVVYVELPDYSSPIGQNIKQMLNLSTHNLNLNQTMALFALNRLEILPSLILAVLDLYQQNRNKNICIVFDRFCTSNILTMAYKYSKLFSHIKIDGTSIKQDFIVDTIDKFYSLDRVYLDFLDMLSLDRYFLKLLKFDQKAPIFIPLITPEQAIQRIKKDTSRDVIDKYENILVQSIASFLYSCFLEKFNKFNTKLLHQEDKDPEQISKELIYMIDLSIHHKDDFSKSKTRLINLSYSSLDLLGLKDLYNQEFKLVSSLIFYINKVFSLNFSSTIYEAVS